MGAAHEDEIRGQLEPEPAAAVDWRRAGGRRAAWETPAVWALAIAAGVAAAFAGCHPTGTPVIDPLYTALFAAAVTLAASRAGRATVLWLGFVATAATRGKGILVAPAVAALGVAFAGAFPRRARPVVGATAGALAVEVALRWSSFGFHGATALVAAAAVLPCLASATVRLPSWGRRWVRRGAIAVVVVAVVLVIPVVVEGLATHGRVNRGIVASESALGSVSAGDAGSATTQLAEATSDFSRSAGALGAWWTAGARLVPVAAQQRQAVAGAVEVAARVTGAAKQQAANIDFSTLHYANGRIDLAQVAALQGPLQTVAGTLDTGAGRLAALRSEWLVGPIASPLHLLDAQVTKARSNADLAAAAVKAAPSLLGGEGTRHYFVAFINPAESRGLGGLIASYAELTAENGHIDLSASGDIGGLNQQLAAAGGGHISAPADYLARYGQFHPGQFFQDLSFSPDLPSVTEVISQMYAEAGHPKIDGVLVLDPRSMASMLSFTGPIDVPGLGQLTASNAAETLTVGQYAAFPSPSQQTDRQAALHDALRLAFEHLTGGSLPGPRALADAFSGDARRGDLRFWSVHPQDQPLLARLHLAGAFPKPAGGDLLAVVTQDAAANKIDAYLQRSITDKVSYDPSSGLVTSTVRIGLHNLATPTGLPAVVVEGQGGGLPAGTNQVYLSLYSPLHLTSVRLGSKDVGWITTPELGVETYSTWVNIAPGATATLTVQLQGKVRPGSSYRLAMFQQPTVRPDQVSVSVAGSPGWSVVGPATWDPGLVAEPFRVFSFRRSP